MNIAEAKNQIETVEDTSPAMKQSAYLIARSAASLFLPQRTRHWKTAVVGRSGKRKLGIGLVSYSMTHTHGKARSACLSSCHKRYGDEVRRQRKYDERKSSHRFTITARKGYDRGFFFLDEIDCVSETLYPSMLQFLQFKTFGRHKIPDGWTVVCAGNPPEYNRSVYDFDVVTLDRLRKIAVEPDLEAWRAYAIKTGVHPAILSYLEVKPDHFYSVESTPDGKSFVTARGWDDLSRIIKLREMKGKTVDRILVDQFLQDDSIAERFAQYYLLFTKYRSDYQISAILTQAAPPTR